MQLNNYCNACVIVFDSLLHRDNCFAHVRMLESNRRTSLKKDTAGPSSSGPVTGLN